MERWKVGPDRGRGGLSGPSFQRSVRQLLLPAYSTPRSVFRCTDCGAEQPKWAGRKTERPLDTRRLLRRGGIARGVVVEPRVFLLEMQLDRAGRTVALLPDDDFGDSFNALVALRVHRAVVELLPVDETHHVGVLLDRARLTQVGELRPAVLAAPLLRSRAPEQ